MSCFVSFFLKANKGAMSWCTAGNFLFIKTSVYTVTTSGRQGTCCEFVFAPSTFVLFQGTTFLVIGIPNLCHTPKKGEKGGGKKKRHKKLQVKPYSQGMRDNWRTSNMCLCQSKSKRLVADKIVKISWCMSDGRI